MRCAAGLPAARSNPPFNSALSPFLHHSMLGSLEMDKGGYERSELETLSASLPCLTRLVLAGGLVGSHLPDW